MSSQRNRVRVRSSIFMAVASVRAFPPGLWRRAAGGSNAETPPAPHIAEPMARPAPPRRRRQAITSATRA